MEIKNSNYISKTNIASKLKIDEKLVEDALYELSRMSYIKENNNINSCNLKCSGCSFAKSCNKFPIKTIIITEKGEKLLQR